MIDQTANWLSVAKDLAIEADCNDYISKPIEITALMELIQKYFNNTNNKN